MLPTATRSGRKQNLWGISDSLTVGVQRGTRYSQCGGYTTRFARTIPTESHFFSHSPPPLFPFFAPFFALFARVYRPLAMGLPPIVTHPRKLCTPTPNPATP